MAASASSAVGACSARALARPPRNKLHYFLTTAEHGSFSEAALALHLAQPSVSEQVRSVHCEELVVVSRYPERVGGEMTSARLADLQLVLYDAAFGSADPTRRQLVERAQQNGVTLRPVIEVEDMEAALQIGARGLADTVVARAVLRWERSACKRRATSGTDG